MELSFALDLLSPPTGDVVGGKANGNDATTDVAAEAFAALFAALVGGIAPATPEPIAVADPSTPAPVGVDAAPVGMPAALGFSSPELVSDTSQRDENATAATANATVVPFASPIRPTIGRDGDEQPTEGDDVSVPAAPKASTTHPSAHVPTTAPTPAPEVLAAPAAISSPPPPQGGGERDENAERPAHASPTAIDAMNTPQPARVVNAARASIAPTAPPVVHGTPTEQVVKAVAPLRKLPDGTHRVVLELHPAELGSVRVELSFDGGTVHLGLHAEVDATSQLLHAALPQLRAELDAAGLVAGRVAVDAGAAGRRDPRPTWEATPRHSDADTTTDDEPQRGTPRQLVAAGHVDVLL